MKQTRMDEIGISDKEATFKEIRLIGLERDVTFLGYLSDDGRAELIPANDDKILPEYRLIYIE